MLQIYERVLLSFVYLWHMQQKILELTTELNEATEKYYKQSTSPMSDYEFDMKLRELAQLEKEYPQYRMGNSPVGRVGSDLDPAFEKVAHKNKMLSIENSYSYDEVQAWMSGILKEHPSAEFMADLKIDGLSLSAKYENGMLVQAITRGDGLQGDDVTENAKVIRNLPRVIAHQGPLEVRGEVYMPHDNFHAINAAYAKAKKQPLKNPRNAASGTLKLKDVREVARRGLNLIAFRLIDPEAMYDQEEQVRILKNLGFEVNPATKIKDISDFESLATKVAAKRAALPFDIDGIVVKVRDAHMREEIGEGDKYILWATAYKYPSEQVRTKMVSLTLQVGRTGKITPVAELTPVDISGSTVRRATLHNFEEIERLGLCEGDTVLLEKGGEIIPKIVGVCEELRGASIAPIKIPAVCPVCASALEKGEEADLRCNNIECPAQGLRRVEHFVSKQCMNVEDLGPALVEQLVSKGLVKEPLDIYKLSVQDIMSCDRMALRSATKIWDAIQASKSAGGERLIFGLGIRQVGKNTSKSLIRAFGTVVALWGATKESLLAIPDIGEETSASILSWLSKHPEIPALLNTYELSTISAAGASLGDAFKGETVVFTGDMASMERSEAQALVERLGGRSTGSVSKKSTLVVVGPGAGSKKAKAEELGIPILNEAEFLQRAGVDLSVLAGSKAAPSSKKKPAVVAQPVVVPVIESEVLDDF